MEQGKKFISPGAWFSIVYPATWNEFEDSEECFLFYNPDEWSGNFRISAYRGQAGYGKECVQQELAEESSARQTQIGGRECARSKEMFEEKGTFYTIHRWVVDAGAMVVECSFTVPRGASAEEAERILASLEVREPGRKYPAEIIPIRISEIFQIDESYEWVSGQVKQLLKKDFQGVEEDIAHMQQVVEKGGITPAQKEAWLSLGIVLCVILTNEADGLEWRTLIDGNREAPVLMNLATGKWTDPMKLTWSKVKAGKKVDLEEAYKEISSNF